MINKYIKQEYIQSKHTCTCITELNKINMTKIKGLHRFDATFNNMLLHIVVVSLFGGGNRRASYIKSYRVHLALNRG